MASRIPKEIIVVSESGITSRRDIDQLHEHGIRAVLIGESFMRAANPGIALRALLATSKDAGR
jgi:indole-3-glycerol phosphate synthase